MVTFGWLVFSILLLLSCYEYMFEDSAEQYSNISLHKEYLFFAVLVLLLLVI